MRKLRAFGVVSTFAVLATTSLAAAALPADFKTRRLSLAPNGDGANSGSWNVDMSANGRFVAFVSYADNLVPEDENGLSDVFVRDTETGSIRRVSIHSFGTEANEGDPYSGYYAVAISANGRFVAFDSGASDLVEGDENGLYDIFLHDRKTRETRRVSAPANGDEPDAESLQNLDISGDGQFIAYSSEASNLVANDDNANMDVFVYNRSTGKTRRVSVHSTGSEADGGNSGEHAVAITPDGRYVAFDSAADDLVAGDENGYHDIFVHDRATGKTRVVSLANNEDQGDAGSYANVDISANGNLVAFSSDATNLVPADDDPGFSDVFVRNLELKTTQRVSVRSNGDEGDGASGMGVGSGYYDTMLRISPSGRYVAFASDATNLVAGDTAGFRDVFVHDRKTRTTERASVKTNGGQGDDGSGLYGVAMSADGRFVAYASFATDLAPSPDGNGGDYDIYLSGPVHD